MSSGGWGRVKNTDRVARSAPDLVLVAPSPKIFEVPTFHTLSPPCHYCKAGSLYSLVLELSLHNITPLMPDAFCNSKSGIPVKHCLRESATLQRAQRSGYELKKTALATVHSLIVERQAF